MVILNLSGGGAAAMGFHAGAIERLEEVQGLNFDQCYTVSAGGLVGVCWASIGIKKTIQAFWDIPDAYDPLYWSWAKYGLGWGKMPKAIVHYQPLWSHLYRILEHERLQKDVVIQCADLYTKKPVYFAFEPGDPAINALEYAIHGMKIPGLLNPHPFEDKLLVDAGAVENSISWRFPHTEDAHLAQIYTLAVHGAKTIDLTPDQYKDADILDMLGQTIGSMSHIMYRDDKRLLNAQFPTDNIRYIEAEKKLEVFKITPQTIKDAYSHGRQMAKKHSS